MKKSHLVNWADCMALSADVFNQGDNYFIDRISDSIEIRTNSYNYGLLPIQQAHNTENGIQISQHVTGHVEVRLQYCNAVTSSGVRICYDSLDMGADLVKNYAVESDIKKNINQWDIIISVDPSKRITYGEIDPEENPPRHPYAESSYRLYVMPKGEVNTQEFGSHNLIIGRIRKETDRLMVDADFIPPCITINSHPELQKYYVNFGNMFRALESYSKFIIAKIHARDNGSGLASNISLVCREMMRQIAARQFDYTNKGSHYAPIDVLSCVSGLAHIVYTSFSFLSGPQKEEVLKYFYEWSDVTPGSFEELLANTLEMLYDHTDIRASMIQANTFMYTITELWQRLSTLEYIGQHKDNIVVSERTMGSNTSQTKTWTIMD